MFHYQDLPYILKLIYFKLINRYYNNFLASKFDIKKTKKLIVKKYYLLMLQKNIEAYIKGCNVYLALKAIYYKLYRDFIPLHILNY